MAQLRLTALSAAAIISCAADQSTDQPPANVPTMTDPVESTPAILTQAQKGVESFRKQTYATEQTPRRIEDPSSIPVAITVDDLSTTGQPAMGWSKEQVAQTLLEAFQRHGVPQVYGFVNARKVERMGDRQILEMWRDAGHPLGNHTYTHPDIRMVTVDAYIQDIADGEPLVAEIMGAENEAIYKTFRFTHSREGVDLDSRNRLHEYLASTGYRIAPLTIDFFDWAYHSPFARCVLQDDQESLQELRQRFLDASLTSLAWSSRAAQEFFGRQIKHILLMHIGAFDADMIEAFLTTWEQHGVRWISLDEAMTDPVYAIDTQRWEGQMLQQHRAISAPMFDEHPALPTLAGFCP